MRLDHYLTEKKVVKTRSQALDLIKRGLVFVNGRSVIKAGFDVKTDDLIKIEEEITFVSRGGHKLYSAIMDFKVDFRDKIVLDIGSSTGGFTDCSLKLGASMVYAYDVGKDQMDENLRLDPRVKLFEETNILSVNLPQVDIILIDVSFTSIKPIFEHIQGFDQVIIALIKPQFEAGKMYFKQGVLKDQKVVHHILVDICQEVIHLGFKPKRLIKSELKGKKGNQEYLMLITPDKSKSVDELIREATC